MWETFKNQELLSLVLSIASLVITGLATWAVTEFTSYLKEKTQDIKLRKFLDIAKDAVITAVKETMQVYVNSLKETGEWSVENEEIARQKALLKAQDLMGLAAWEALNTFMAENGGASNWVLTRINAVIEEVKLIRQQRKMLEVNAKTITETIECAIENTIK